jgi:transcriptional regulator with XRE-family HTH domain
MNKKMTNHGKILEKLLIEKDISKSQFCNMIGVTPSNYKYYFGKEIIDNKYLDKINELLGIDLNYQEPEPFVSIGILDAANTNKGVDLTKDLYERLLAEKERIIKEKDAHIEDLRKMLFIQRRDNLAT